MRGLNLSLVLKNRASVKFCKIPLDRSEIFGYFSNEAGSAVGLCPPFPSLIRSFSFVIKLVIVFVEYRVHLIWCDGEEGGHNGEAEDSHGACHVCGRHQDVPVLQLHKCGVQVPE